MNESTHLGAWASLCSSITWALGITAYSQMARHHSPYVINFTRAIIGFVLFLGSALAFSSWSGTAFWVGFEPKDFFWFLISQISSYGLGDACLIFSSLDLGIPGALAIASTYPVWSALVGLLFRGEALTVLGWAGLCLCVAGTIVVIVFSSPATHAEGSHRKRSFQRGVLLAFLTSFFWSLNTIAISQTSKGMSPYTANSVRMFVSIVLCSGFARFFYPQESLFLPRATYRRYLLVIVLETFLGSLFFLYGLKNAPLAVAAALSALAPAVAAPLAWWRKTEPFHGFTALGIAGVVLGVVLLVGFGRA